MRSNTITTSQVLDRARRDEQDAEDELQRAYRLLERATVFARRSRAAARAARLAHEQAGLLEDIEQFGVVA